MRIGQITEERRNLIVFTLMLLLVPLAGEPKIHPFSGELASFRVSFGSPLFLLFLLWLRNTSFVLSGFCVGLSVAIFRICLDLTGSDLSLASSLQLRGPTFFYYLVYAASFRLPRTETRYHKALQIAGWSIGAEFLASIAELMVSILCSGAAFVITLPVLLKIIYIAVLRCFFILSFFFLAQLYESESRASHEHKQTKQLLLLIANLYEEIVQLSKSQKNAEGVTRNCYKLYEQLQNSTGMLPDRKDLASALLNIAGQVHEIKKDNQRIQAGLYQLTNNRRLNDFMAPRELISIIVQSNQKYAHSLNKNIVFSTSMDPLIPNLHVYTVLSLVNNLVSNAVEAIESSGTIAIHFTMREDFLQIKVSDSGAAIPLGKMDLVFTPGYTTKFDSAGNPSTGVGLPYVKHLVEELGGNVSLLPVDDNQTTFILTIPIKMLKG